MEADTGSRVPALPRGFKEGALEILGALERVGASVSSPLRKRRGEGTTPAR
jgi:hypothetical protein